MDELYNEEISPSIIISRAIKERNVVYTKESSVFLKVADGRRVSELYGLDIIDFSKLPKKSDPYLKVRRSPLLESLAPEDMESEDFQARITSLFDRLADSIHNAVTETSYHSIRGVIF
ncbi:hypothetical protein HK096_009755 [Nowakowskiella sp. JEL0078]|nr:hypothetical protein HK096_009755 [Nowakowskiella sp. JEL0078]